MVSKIIFFYQWIYFIHNINILKLCYWYKKYIQYIARNLYFIFHWYYGWKMKYINWHLLLQLSRSASRIYHHIWLRNRFKKWWKDSDLSKIRTFKSKSTHRSNYFHFSNCNLHITFGKHNFMIWWFADLISGRISLRFCRIWKPQICPHRSRGTTMSTWILFC